MIIAIDGSTASGKGTLAKRVAAQFELPHMDTGLLYRATGASAMKAGVDLDDEAACAQIAQDLALDRFEPAALRTAEVGQAASKIAALPTVREALLKLQREFAGRPGGAVLDGRDIGTVICPNADVKLWIDADLDVRAQRRAAELAQMGAPISAEDMARQLRERDARDKSRDVAPMKPAEDAVLLDTTHLSIEDMVSRAIEIIQAAQKPS